MARTASVTKSSTAINMVAGTPAKAAPAKALSSKVKLPATAMTISAAPVKAPAKASAKQPATAAPVKAPAKAAGVFIIPAAAAAAAAAPVKALAPPAKTGVKEMDEIMAEKYAAHVAAAEPAVPAVPAKAEKKAAKKAASGTAVANAPEVVTVETAVIEMLAASAEASSAVETVAKAVAAEHATVPAVSEVLTAQYVIAVGIAQNASPRAGFTEALLQSYLTQRCATFISKVGAPASAEEMKEAVASVSHNLYFPPLYADVVGTVTPPEELKEGATFKAAKGEGGKGKENGSKAEKRPAIGLDTTQTLRGNVYYTTKKNATMLSKAGAGAGNAVLVAKQVAFDIPVDAAVSVFNTLTGRHPERVPAYVREKAAKIQKRVENAPNFFAAIFA